MGLTTKIKASIEWKQTGSPEFGTSVKKFDGLAAIDLASGTGANLADVVYADTRTLAASANESLDLNALTDPEGLTVNFAKIKAILIKAAAGNTNNVVVGDGASTPFLGPLGGTTPTIAIPPGGFMFLGAPVAGWASTTGVADLLKIANSGGTTGVTFTLMLIGCSV